MATSSSNAHLAAKGRQPEAEQSLPEVMGRQCEIASGGEFAARDRSPGGQTSVAVEASAETASSGTAEHSSAVFQPAGAPLRSGRCSLLCTTLAHALFNFGIGATISIPGLVLESLKHQAGDGNALSSVILLAAAAGNIPGVMLGGYALDRFPAHCVLFAAALASALNLAVMPFARGVFTVAMCNAAIYFGNGVLDCSFSVLGWSVRDHGLSDSSMFLSAKTVGTMLGCISATRIAAAWDVSGGSYDVLAYSYSGLCLAAGAAFLLLPSPLPPAAAAAAQREGSPKSDSRIWRSRLVVLVGSVLLMVVLGCFCAATTLTSHLPRPIEDSILGVFYVANVVSVLGSAALARRLSTWKTLVLLFLTAAGSSALMAGAYLAGPGGAGTQWILRVSYIGLGSVMAAFPLCFALIESLVRLSGAGTTVLAGGAALGPLLTAVVADLSPAVLWFVISGLLASSAVVVTTLHYTLAAEGAAVPVKSSGEQEGRQEEEAQEQV